MSHNTIQPTNCLTKPIVLHNNLKHFIIANNITTNGLSVRNHVSTVNITRNLPNDCSPLGQPPFLLCTSLTDKVHFPMLSKSLVSEVHSHCSCREFLRQST